MKKLVLPLTLFFALVAHAGTIITAFDNFDSFTPSTVLGKTFSFQGVTLSSTAPLIPATGYFSSELFGWGSAPSGSPALAVNSTSWLKITAGGEVMSDVNFLEGIDWDGFAIEAGLLTTYFNWVAWLDGVPIDYGTTQNGAHYHGSGMRDYTLASGFDALWISSTGSGYGSANHIAIDNLTVVYDPPEADPVGVGVPDFTSSAALLLIGLGVVASVRKTRLIT